MAIGDDFEIQNDKDIRYIGAAHGATGAGYYTVLEFHRWLQDRADDAAASGDDFMDMTKQTPSDKSFDTIINLINGFNIDDTAAEHLYSGSILQSSGAEIWDGLQVIANQGMDLQIIQNGAVITNDFWNYNVKGTHTGSNNVAVLTDSTKSWSTDQWVGYFIKNTTDGSVAKITANTATTITGTLYGGTDNDWDSSDAYSIVQGLNFSVASGYSHQFMLKVRTAGADIDGRRIIGQTRVWTKTFSEFRIGTGTGRGNNVLALQYADDANNTTAYASLSSSPFTSISLTTAGYNGIDVNNDTTDEFFYSEWNRGTASINQFYEYQKFLTLGSNTTNLYGYAGRLVRGITHEVVVDTPTGTFSAQEALSWSGGTGRLLAINSTTAATKLWLQLLTGVAPTDNQTITGGTSSATCLVNVTVTERTLSFPYMGSSTGSAISGAYGFGVEALDLTASDKLVDLNNTTYSPPNFVTFTVQGLVSGEDYVLVTNDESSNIDFDQMTLNGALTGAAVTAVVVNGSIPADTPSTGTIRILRASGIYSRHAYTAWSGSTFTIGSTNFSTNNAANGANVFISYIDKLAASTSEAFTAVFSSTRTLFIRVRDGGASPIKTFESTGTLGSAGGSATAVRTSDL